MSGHDEDDRPIDRSLIDAAMPGLTPSDAQRKRLRSAVLGALATSAVTTGTAAGAQAAVGGAGATAATGVGGAAVGMGLGAKVVVAALAIASVVGVAVAVRPTSAPPEAEETMPSEPAATAPRADDVADEARPAAPIEIAATPIEAPTEVAPPSEPAPQPSSPPVARRPTPAAEAPSIATPEEPDPGLAETMLLARARAALQRHDGAAAMQLLQEHASRFPSGELREERLALRVSTLCALGETDRAHREAASYLDAFPGSIHAADVRAADCWSSEPVAP